MVAQTKGSSSLPGILGFRLAAAAWDLHCGYDRTLKRMIERFGGRWQELGGGAFSAQVGTGPVCGFNPGDDPVTCYVQVGFLFFGPYWPFIDEVVKGKKLVDRWWKEETKKKKKLSGDQDE